MGIILKYSDVMIYYDYKMSNVARALGVSRQVIYYWHKRNRVPFSKQCELEILTKGALKANKED
jgi:hypothetical protein